MTPLTAGSAIASQFSDKAKNTLVFGVVALVGFAVYKYVSIGSSIAEGLNLKDSKEDKRAKKVVVSFEKSRDFKLAFTPGAWKGNFSNVITISPIEAIKRAKVINGAFGGLLNDDEEKIYGVYRTTPSKASMVKIAVAYWVTYKKDLYQELRSRLDDLEMEIILKIVKSKKDYTPKK